MDKTQKTVTIDAAPFNIKDKVGYMFGDIGNNFSFNVVNSFLMIFYTNVLGLTGAQVGILFLIARFVDAFADITVGRLVDNSKLHKSGRFKPWMSRMQYPLLIFLVLLFVPVVKDWALPIRLVFVFITYLGWGIFYSCVNIPYGSMAAAISSDPNDKTSLSTFRALGSALGSAITSYIIPLFICIGATQKISGTRFFWVVVVCAFLGWGCYELTIHLTTERIRTE
ncbi:MAG: MFS transporter, partial [Pediococcus acidilactici]|nr:MFS transporter [Pediococcus acidilactici]